MEWTIDSILDSLGLSRNRSIGLAMSGGGARGFSHIGVLRAMEEFGLRPDVISGVSAGSIAAVLYGAGLTPYEIMECFKVSNRFGDYTDWSIPKEGFLRLERFGKMLDSWLPVKDLSEMKIPTIVCATDLDHGKSVGWAKGSIVERVLASCSIPVIFAPVKINGVNYVDGGVLRNLPAWCIREHVSVLIGSNCSPLSRQYRYKTSIIDIAFRSYQLMAKANSLQDINLCDYVVQADGMSQFKTFDISQMNRIMLTGYEAACRILEKIKR